MRFELKKLECRILDVENGKFEFGKTFIIAT